MLVSECFQNSTTGQESGSLVYIAGPMSGDLAGNLPVFFEAEANLRAAGHTTFNPARIDGGRTPAGCIDLALKAQGRRTWAWYMRRGLAGLIRCNAIALLPRWNASEGARIECRLAGQLGMDYIHWQTGDLIHDPTPGTLVRTGETL